MTDHGGGRGRGRADALIVVEVDAEGDEDGRESRCWSAKEVVSADKISAEKWGLT